MNFICDSAEVVSMVLRYSIAFLSFCSAIFLSSSSFFGSAGGGGSSFITSTIFRCSSGVTGGRSESTLRTALAMLIPTMTSTMMRTPTTLVMVSIRATNGSSCSSCLRFLDMGLVA